MINQITVRGARQHNERKDGVLSGPEASEGETRAPSVAVVLREWGRIGCIGFGGPPTHIKLLRELCAAMGGADGRGGGAGPGRWIHFVQVVRRRSAADPRGRVPFPASRDEISRLAVTLNDMLARLQAAFEHERRFVADASHELRTHLALLQAAL